MFYSDRIQGPHPRLYNGEHNFSFTALDMGIADPFHLSDEQLQAAKDKLIDMKNNLLSLYSTADEALQLYQQNDVAIIWANYGQQQVKMMKAAGAPIAYVNAKEGALAWLDTWAITSGVQNQDLAEKWVNFVLQKKISGAAVGTAGFWQHGGRVPERRSERQDRLAGLGGGPDQAGRSVERDQGGAIGAPSWATGMPAALLSRNHRAGPTVAVSRTYCLTANVNSGEAYDFYYADDAARAAQTRLPITDGLGKPWIYRQKDLWNFWSQPHYERFGGVELPLRPCRNRTGRRRRPAHQGVGRWFKLDRGAADRARDRQGVVSSAGRARGADSEPHLLCAHRWQRQP